MKENATEPIRILCSSCLQPEAWCYCKGITPLDTGIDFVILQHPLERRRRIATGRMAFLCLTGSQIIHGFDYTDDPQVDSLIQNPKYHCMMLYPEAPAANLDRLTLVEKQQLIPVGTRLLVFVVDGTWSTAKKSVNRSTNLMKLPRLFFRPQARSNFRIRKQPAENCFSTIEAVHQCIELLGDVTGFDVSMRKHDVLLEVFDGFVERHIAHKKMLQESGAGLAPRQVKKKQQG